MIDVTALGELLIDFTPHGTSDKGNPVFERNPGGAPANVLAALSKLGAGTAFIGKVGQDQFGLFLRDTLADCGIDVSGLVFSEKVNTTLAFVHLSPTGDRSFSFYRNPGADMMLEKQELNEQVITDSKIFHFGSISLTDEPAKSATMEALSIAKKAGILISYDPNLRPPLWKSLDDAKREIVAGLAYADVLKISEEELEFITGEKDLVKGSKILADRGIGLIFVTLGAKGTFYRHIDDTGHLHTYDTKVIDTTGAGDAFLGGVLFKLKDYRKDQIAGLTKEQVEDMVDFGNAMGSLTATRKGAIPAVPSMEEVLRCKAEMPKLIK